MRVILCTIVPRNTTKEGGRGGREERDERPISVTYYSRIYTKIIFVNSVLPIYRYIG